jgi:hypothetical protein
MENQINHPEWRKNNTLSALENKADMDSLKLKQFTPALTEEQTELAMKDLNNTAFIEKYPATERLYSDSSVPMQKIGLISFVPAKGATPNKNGVYAYAKLRGNFDTTLEANQRAEYIIKNEDSYHQIYHTWVGKPFPITVSSDYSREVSKIDIKKEMTQSMNESIKEKREKEKREIKEVEEREKELLEDVSKEEPDPMDYYLTLRSKYANQIWRYQEVSNHLVELREKIIKNRLEINDLDEKTPELRGKYFAHYLEARKKAGLPNNKEDLSKSFVKYLGEDIHLDFLEKIDKECAYKDEDFIKIRDQVRKELEQERLEKEKENKNETLEIIKEEKEEKA